MGITNLFPDIWAIIRVGLSAVVASGLAIWIFRTLGEKWLSSKFDKQLESYRHAQQKELERLKFNINALMDRTTKLHQYEFDVLPQLWALLNESYSEVARFTSSLQSYPDLDRMEEAQLSEFLQKCELDQWQKIKLTGLNLRNKEYQDMIFWHNLNKANSKFMDFNNYYIKNCIFIQEELKVLGDGIRDMMSDALFEKKHDREYPQPREGRYAKCDLFREQGSPKLEEFSALVQNRLWNARSLDG